MRPVDIIRKKRDGAMLLDQEIRSFFGEFMDGRVAEYQVTAFLMAVYFNGMSLAETVALTETMIGSGTVIDFSDCPDISPGTLVDKHSTGGVGDKISLILAPLVAEAGVKIPMISGRGLGHTGGTLDKLEAIPGFNTQLDITAMRATLQKVGVALVGQTDDLVPMDRRLYALRDVTATVENRSLIAASIMSKKIAEGIDGLVIDLKCGNGAFMKSLSDAQDLAKLMMSVGQALGKKVTAVITDMNQPLGNFVGNALEVGESIQVLCGEGPGDLETLSIEIGSHMVCMAGICDTHEDGRRLLLDLLASGKGIERFERIIAAQGGDPSIVSHPERLPKARCTQDIVWNDAGGYVTEINTELIGHAANNLGAGRIMASDTIDHSAGIHIRKKIGDLVVPNEPVATIYFNKGRRDIGQSVDWIRTAYTVMDQQISPPPLIIDRIANGV